MGLTTTVRVKVRVSGSVRASRGRHRDGDIGGKTDFCADVKVLGMMHPNEF